MRDIRNAVAIEISQREAIGRSFPVAELDLSKLASRSGIKEDRRPRGDIADDNVWTAIEVQIAGGKSVRNSRPILKFKTFPKAPLSIVHVHDHQRRGLIADDEIQIAITIEVGSRSHTRRSFVRSKRKGSREIRLAIIEVDPALAAVALGNGKVDVAIVIEIGRDDAGRGSRRNRETRR